MTTQIANALSQGFTSKQIIEFLIKQFPTQARQIQKAISSGYTAEQVLKFLSGGRKELASSSQQMGTEHARTRGTDIQRREAVTSGAIKGAGLAGLGVAGAIASPMAAQALQRAAPQLFGPGAVTQISGQTPNQSPQGQPPVQNAGITSPQQPPISPTIPQPEAKIQPEVKTIDIGEILNKHGLAKKVEEFSSRTKDPNAITALLYQKFPKEMKAFQAEAGKPMEEAIAEYMQSKPEAVKPLDIEASKIEEKAPEIGLNVGDKFTTRRGDTATLTQVNDKTFEYKTDNGGVRSGPISALKGEVKEEAPETESAKIEKGSVAASPQGIGSILEIRNGKALIDIDGKKHQVNEDELIQSPLPEKDLADLYEELTQGIEKKTGKQVSRNVEWAGYDPKTNELAYKPHGSDQLYAYDDISPEDIEILTNFLTQRKSTGESFIGAWEAGTESPIGAAMYQLIKKLQSERGGKGNEYKNKFMTIYDALEPAKKALKERYAERKKKAKKPRPY